jgi:hypothetical protein
MSDDFYEQEDQEEDVYGSAAREQLEENDEISPEEEAFMEGYESDFEEDDEEEDDDYEDAFDEASSK